jgi:predicted TIM-barrel fold metal-dependent hydrolase
MKIIDAHCHIHKPQWNTAGKKEQDFFTGYLDESRDEKQVLDNMTEAGIEKAVIFPYPSILINLEVANHYTAAISRKHPGKFVPFTIIDDKPGYWRANGVKGFKEHTYGQRIQRDSNGENTFSQKFKETYRYMEKHQVPLLLHAGVNRVQRLQEDIFKDTPDLPVILAHLGADFPEDNNHRPRLEQVRTTLAALKDHPTLYFDISAISEPGILMAALDIVGTEKLNRQYIYRPQSLKIFFLII